MRLKSMLKQSCVSLFVSAGVLSIANIETLWREDAHRGDYETVRLEAKQHLKSRLEKSPSPAKATGPSEDLRDSLGAVEIGDSNPFVKLANLSPLNAVFKKGVASFKRQTYRSPRYRAEAGYDLVEYQIKHPDDTRSTVLAYLEPTLEGVEFVPVVLIVHIGPEKAEQAIYRNGTLAERGVVPLSVAQSQVNRRLDSGVPFLSVSR